MAETESFNTTWQSYQTTRQPRIVDANGVPVDQSVVPRQIASPGFGIERVIPIGDAPVSILPATAVPRAVVIQNIGIKTCYITNDPTGEVTQTDMPGVTTPKAPNFRVGIHLSPGEYYQDFTDLAYYVFHLPNIATPFQSFVTVPLFDPFVKTNYVRLAVSG